MNICLYRQESQIQYIIIVSEMHHGIKSLLAYSRLLCVQDQRKQSIASFLKNSAPWSSHHLAYISTLKIPIPIQAEQNSHKASYKQPYLQQNLIDFTNPKIIQIEKSNNQKQQYITKGIQYQANNKIQDRLLISDLKSIKAQLVAVFDGHGGDRLSDYCYANLVDVLDSWIQGNKNLETYAHDHDKLISHAFDYAYDKIDQDFYQNIYKIQVALNNKKIRGVGTCALAVLIYNNKIYVANSGDSEAIQVFKDKYDNITYVELNERFSVNNPSERDRLKKQFPEDEDIIVEETTGSFYVKGRLQPTKALGDYHLKYSQFYKGKGKFNGPYIHCTPDIKIFEITQNLKRIVIASDGVWDFVDKETVARASMQSRPHEQILEKSLEKVASLHRKSIEEIKQISNEYKRSFHDDISIAVINISGIGKD